MASLILSLSQGLHLLPPSPSFVLQPILCFLWSQLQKLWMGLLSLLGQALQQELCGSAGRGSCLPCPAGAEESDRLPFLIALQTKGPLPVPAVLRWEVQEAALGARGLSMLRLCLQTQLPLFRVWCTDEVSVSSCRRRRRSH